MKKEKKRFSVVPSIEDLYDYKKSTYLKIFTVWVSIATVSASILSSNPMGMWIKFIIDAPIFLIMLFVFRKLLHNDIKIFVGNLKRYIPFVLIGFVLYIIVGTLGNNISTWLGAETSSNQAAVEAAFSQTPFLGAMVIVIFAPIVEELMFRRAIKVMVTNKFFYYLLSALLFGMAHLVIGFSFPSSFAFIFSYALCGLCLAFVYDVSRNIWCNTIIHMLNNGIGVIIMFASLYETF